ncbi:hypothetical protein EJ066_03390 [Mesorhizobium sp. M9A.F.Ca.ET.002.03.1.2]|uniref:hypothetical protein n=1 Tax=Mesorhizobium sp. M9A.F.Ca.ET.002.03.1.2 TaxID=2493668 RepID=UPI000F760926|nr:hypothetical protein [Mesorhizobium sp. M9A.F.Ca.ET.002.03.1.2]AZN96408.1 hypothetical protein EJ066_03390 [Mesorhizobium sp. M9A.F.Ca.ET.002.03.1.2]
MRRSVKTERPRISEILTRIVDRLAIKSSDKRTINGMVIVYDADKGGRDADRVAAALQLIQEFDPVRYRRLVRDLKQIWITTIPGAAGRFVKSTSTCELDERFVLGKYTVVEQVAGAIVHEATHARLDQRGISYEEKLRDRVEQVCMERELAFAAKLPDGSRIRQWVEARQKEPSDYSDVALDASRIQSARAALLHLNTPSWFADMIVFFARWRHERHIRRQEAQRHFDKRN